MSSHMPHQRRPRHFNTKPTQPIITCTSPYTQNFKRHNHQKNHNPKLHTASVTPSQIKLTQHRLSRHASPQFMPPMSELQQIRQRHHSKPTLQVTIRAVKPHSTSSRHTYPSQRHNVRQMHNINKGNHITSLDTKNKHRRVHNDYSTDNESAAQRPPVPIFTAAAPK